MKVRDDDGKLIADVVSIPDYLATRDRDPAQSVRGGAFDLQYERHGRWVGQRLQPWPATSVEDQQWKWTRFDSTDKVSGRVLAEQFMDVIDEKYEQGRVIDLR